jgi:hypothetical protein
MASFQFVMIQKVKESLIKPFDKALLKVVEGLRTNGNLLITFV